MGRPRKRDFYEKFYRRDYLDRLEKARLRKGLTHNEIANMLGVSRQSISDVFHRRNQNPAMIEAVAGTVGVFFAQLTR